MWGSCRCSGNANVSPVASVELSCICSDKLYSPSIDVRLCCCLFVHFDMSSRLVSALFLFPGICWWKAWLLCSPWKCCWSWDVSLEALCKESKATGRGNRVTSAESPNASVSFTVLCKASLDFTVKTPKNKTKKSECWFASVWYKVFHMSTEVTGSWSSQMNWSRRGLWRSARGPWGWAPNRCAWVWLYRKREYESTQLAVGEQPLWSHTCLWVFDSAVGAYPGCLHHAVEEYTRM